MKRAALASSRDPGEEIQDTNTTMKFLSILGFSFAAFVSSSANGATILSVDFGSSDTLRIETGFEVQIAASKVHSTTEGNVTVASDGAFFNRGAGGVNANLLTDFTFSNSGSTTITLSGVGITASTAYGLKFWAFDSNTGAKAHTNEYAAVAGSLGSAPSVSYGPSVTNATSVDDYSTTGTFTSNGSGILTITVTDTSPTGSDESRVNGFQLSTIPESSAALLGVIGFLALLRRRR